MRRKVEKPQILQLTRFPVCNLNKRQKARCFGLDAQCWSILLSASESSYYLSCMRWAALWTALWLRSHEWWVSLKNAEGYHYKETAIVSYGSYAHYLGEKSSRWVKHASKLKKATEQCGYWMLSWPNRAHHTHSRVRGGQIKVRADNVTQICAYC